MIMASNEQLSIIPPFHYKSPVVLNTELKLREGIESINRCMINQGKEAFDKGEHRWYAWVASPTFNGCAEQTVICNTCVRMEAIFLGYTFAIWTINNVHEELRELVLRRLDLQQKTSSTGHATENNDDVSPDPDDMRNICNRLYLVYLVLVDSVKGNLVLWNQRSHPYPSAEYYTETCDVLINICAGLHTIAFIEYGQSQKKGAQLSKTTWARLFLFVAIRFERAYFILTNFVWVMYGGGNDSAIALQRICMGYLLYYRAKAYILVILSITDNATKESKTHKNYSDSEYVLALAQQSLYLLQPLVKNPFFGFQTRSKKLIDFSEMRIREHYSSVPITSITRRRITTREEYDQLESIVSECINDSQARNMLQTPAHIEMHHRYFQPDPQYGNYDGFLYHAMERN